MEQTRILCVRTMKNVTLLHVCSLVNLWFLHVRPRPFGSQLRVKLNWQGPQISQKMTCTTVLTSVDITCLNMSRVKTMSCHYSSQVHIFFIFCPTGCFPPSDCEWPSLLCLILLCKQIAPVLATQNKIHRLSEVEAQLTEL